MTDLVEFVDHGAQVCFLPFLPSMFPIRRSITYNSAVNLQQLVSQETDREPFSFHPRCYSVGKGA